MPTQEDKIVFQPKTIFCKDKEGNLIGGKDEVLRRPTEYFHELLI
jgi:hypothetical protein